MNSKSGRISLLIIAIQLIQICFLGNSAAASSETDKQIDRENESLQAELDALTARAKAKQSPRIASILSDSLEQVKKSGVVDSALKVGQTAPDFKLADEKNKIVSLKKLLKKGPVVVCFYRGGWCPYCNLTLHALDKSLPQIKDAGATIVAISPQVREESAATSKKDELHFAVLSDLGNKTAKDFGIAYNIPSELVKVAKAGGIDYQKYNGDDTNQLPLAATFIVKKDGTVAYRFVDADYKKRMEPADIVADLKQIAAK